MGLPQRENRDKLSLSPDNTPATAGWAESYEDPANDLNAAVPLRKKFPVFHNGWTEEPYEALPAGPGGGKSKSDSAA